MKYRSTSNLSFIKKNYKESHIIKYLIHKQCSKIIIQQYSNGIVNILVWDNLSVTSESYIAADAPRVLVPTATNFDEN